MLTHTCVIIIYGRKKEKRRQHKWGEEKSYIWSRISSMYVYIRAHSALSHCWYIDTERIQCWQYYSYALLLLFSLFSLRIKTCCYSLRYQNVTFDEVNEISVPLSLSHSLTLALPLLHLYTHDHDIVGHFLTYIYIYY